MILRHAFIPPDNERLANLAGPLDEHLRTLAQAFEVRIQRRNESFRVEGARDNAERAVSLLQHLYGQAARPIGAEQLALAIVEAQQGAPAAADTSPSRASRQTREPDGRSPHDTAEPFIPGLVAPIASAARARAAAFAP